MSYSSISALQRRAVAVIEIFLQRPGRQTVDPEEIGDVERDALVDLRPDPRVVRVERVVEIEDPGVHVREAARVGGGEVGLGDGAACHSRDGTGPSGPMERVRQRLTTGEVRWRASACGTQIVRARFARGADEARRLHDAGRKCCSDRNRASPNAAERVGPKSSGGYQGCKARPRYTLRHSLRRTLQVRRPTSPGGRQVRIADDPDHLTDFNGGRLPRTARRRRGKALTSCEERAILAGSACRRRGR